MLKTLGQHQSLRVQCLRAFACILLVSYHVIGAGPDSGLRVGIESIWRHLDFIAMPLRMPLFTFLSGYIYAARRPKDGVEWRFFIKRKTQRLWLPYLALTPLFVAGQFLSGREQTFSAEALWALYLIPDTFYWFLSALFLIFTFVSLWDWQRPDTTLSQWLLMLVIWWGLNILQPIEYNVLGIGNALYLGPFFLTGLMLRRFPEKLSTPTVRNAVWAVVLLGYLPYCYAILTSQWVSITDQALTLIPLGIALSLTLIRFFPVVKPLAWVGHYSYSVFLFHIFFITGTRMVLNRLGVHETMALFAGGVTAGVLGPVVVEHLLRRWYWTRLILLGQPGKRGQAGGGAVAASGGV